MALINNDSDLNQNRLNSSDTGLAVINRKESIIETNGQTTMGVLKTILPDNSSYCNSSCCKHIYKAPEISTLDELISELHCVFQGNHVNIEYVHNLMSNYKSNPADWRKFAKFDRYRYTRNLVDEGNGKFNLMILCWGEGHGSAIHDHANAHCFMKLLQGELAEIRFSFPNEENHSEIPNEETPLLEISRSTLETNDVCYINDSLGLHRVENPSHVNTAISLHLYCPPFDNCSVFNQQTGKRTQCQVTFWSKFGQKSNRKIQESRPPEDN